MNPAKTAALLLMVLTAGADCNRKVDAGGFAAVYTALARAADRYETPKLRAAVRDSILGAHGFTAASFRARAEQLYRDEPEQWQELWKTIEKKLDAPVPADAGTETPAGIARTARTQRREAGARRLPPPDTGAIPKAR